MINNYSKNDLLPPPKKKKYTKEHVLMLIFIYYFKSILSISDIQKILSPVTEKYFGSEDGYTLEDIYREVFGLERDQTRNIMKDLARKYEASMNTFSEADPDDADILHTFSFICMLCYDIFVKKTMVERMLDHFE
jgi:DNA-binding transcriptional MerR regulator